MATVEPASISTSQFAIIEETTRGQTPAGAWQVIPFLANSVPPSLEKQFPTSEVVTGNRQPGAACGGTRSGKATLHCYLSKEPGIVSLLEGGLWGDATGLVIPSDLTRHYYEVETRVLLADGSHNYIRLIGAEVASVTITVPLTGCAEITFEFIGTDVQVLTTSSATYTPATNVIPVSAACQNSTVLYGGTVLDGAESLEVRINNNLTPAYAVGLPFAHHVRAGLFEVTGSMGIYYEGPQVLQAFTSETRNSLEVKLMACGSDYLADILIPRILLTAAPMATSGTDLVQSSQFKAELATATPYAIQISFPAAP